MSCSKSWRWYSAMTMCEKEELETLKSFVVTGVRMSVITRFAAITPKDLEIGQRFAYV